MKESQLLSYAEHVWPGYVYLNLLLSDDTASIHHSMIYNPQPDSIQYGDKAVRHWRMDGAADPKFIDVDVNWSGHDGPYSDYWNYRENYWFGGSDISFFECWEYRDRLFQKVRSTRMVVDGNHVYYEAWDRDNDSWWRHPNPICSKTNGRWYQNEGWRSWLLQDVKYELGEPAPYYWMSYMESKKPAIHPGALSECIRNTIQESTSLSTNNFANAFEIVETINDFRNFKVRDLCKKFSDFKNYLHSVRPDLKGRKLRVLNDKDFHMVFDPKTMKKDIILSSYDLNSPGLDTAAKDVSKKLSDGWLKYRYAYNTTKMDVTNFVHQILENNLRPLSDERVLRGRIDVNEGEMRIKMRLHERSGDLLLSIMNTANKAGFFPGLYNLWDMIPFSFVVDWFSPIGDTLEDFDQRWMHDYFVVDELLVSTKQHCYIDDAGFSAELTYYDRQLFDEMPQFEFYDDDSGVSDKTKAYRSLDGVSLLIEAATM
jgi:hypothetical protein